MHPKRGNLLQYRSFPAVIHPYDGIILDLWGVVNDDTGPYPGAIEAIKALHQEGKKIVIVSNSPRLTPAIQDKLSGYGLTPADYDGIITSGEIAHRYFEQRQTSPYGKERYYLIGNAGRGGALLHDMPEKYEQVSDLADADFVLCTAAPDNSKRPDAAALRLQEIQEHGLVMYSANPDIQTPRKDYRQVFCGGYIAAMYEDAGGEVRTFGKPEPEIYEAALRMLEMPKENVVAIGDSLRTDIKGANNAGIDSILVRNEIHTHEVPTLIKPTDLHGLNSQCTQMQVHPTHLVSHFSLDRAQQPMTGTQRDR